MDYQEKYLKYKYKYQNLIKNINDQNNLTEIKQSGGFAIQDVVKITTECEYKGLYGDIISKSTSCYPNNISRTCSVEDKQRAKKDNTIMFDVFEVSIPMKGKRVTPKFIASELIPAESFNLRLNEYVTIKKEGFPSNTIYQYNGIVAHFNKTTEVNDVIGRVLYLDTDSKIVGDFYESEMVLASRFNYVGQHISINTGHKSVSPDNLKKWKPKEGHHGIITNIEYNTNEPDKYNVSIGPNCVFKLGPKEKLLVEFESGILYDHPALRCP